MKKTVLFLGVFFCLLSLQAQFTVEKDNGTPIVDGDIVAFGQVGEPSKLYFHINNTSSQAINIRVECVSLTNTDGSMMQFCILPTCYYSVTEGESYPHEQPNGMSLPVAPGAQSNTGEHFMNTDPGNGADVIDYVFRFYQVNAFGAETGTSLTFTYRYDPLLGISEINKLDIAVYPTEVKEFLTVETATPLEVEIYDLRGVLVKSEKVSKGKNQLSMAGLSSQLYLVQFENEQGETQTTKIIKR